MSESNVSSQVEGIIELSNEVEEQNVSGSEEIKAAVAGNEPEPETEKKPEEAKLDSKLASKFAALSKKEKAIKQKEKELERRMKALEAAQAAKEVPATKPESEPFEVALKRNPLKALAEKGYDFETLAKLALNDGKLTPEMQLQLMKEELESGYKSELAEIKKKLEEKEAKEQEQSVQQQVEGAKKAVNNFIDSQGDEYELIRTNDSYDAVWDLIQGHYEETEELLDFKEAADIIENKLLEAAKKHINLNKIKKLMESSAPKKSETVKKPASQTLTNAQSQEGQGAEDRKNLLSQEESLSAAAKLLKWNE